MPTFELESPTKAKIVNVNPRAELNGKDHVPACDIKLRVELPNSILSCFHGSLLSSLYEAPKAITEPAEGQATIEGVEAVSTMPVLRFPHLEGLRWDRDQTGCTLVIDYGMGGKSNIELGDCRVNAFALDCKDGGTVIVTFRVQCSGVAEKLLGKLCTLIDLDTQITLVGPDADAQASIEPAASKPAPVKTKADAKTPEKALAESLGA